MVVIYQSTETQKKARCAPGQNGDIDRNGVGTVTQAAPPIVRRIHGAMACTDVACFVSRSISLQQEFEGLKAMMTRSLRRQLAFWTFFAVCVTESEHRGSCGWGSRHQPRESVGEPHLPLCALRDIGDGAFQLRLRGGMDELESESGDEETSEEEREYRSRPVMIGRSGGGNSIRIIPAAPGQLLGDPRWYPDDGIVEWVLADPRRKTTMVVPVDSRSVLVSFVICRRDVLSS